VIAHELLMRAFLLALFTAFGASAQQVVVTGTWEPLPLEEADRSVSSLPVRSQSLVLNTFVDLLKLDRLFGRKQYDGRLDPDFFEVRDDARFREVARQLQ